ncbi:helicase IV [Clostridium pasteurianum DSM 525 = ATCC 6013]|uniref:DNA 3'-5' helicase n=2 Tax=Clostridium pasteurianum TaxID=1501 RepID=A0A0H3J1L8_CLOPA|nr:UvrD-helicase domain-containing protein [Clostridium pasteurianum]AJA47294.1 helicase IV [Clostridium pasteurianum DSM 525 = ATCC 6013]AJA51282.1 helicase IV [Clostridium pasteurianum DSM 525 = ATCC 6013]AOZ74635.1 ATP-dependent DNA helicase [Clostridium pasteurianum DSM 525 = ATCC 6013]AOZ78432.1 ATP-dependent DNA helicase [Clostridium pasteurianum]ELP57507.1 Superfamily I DNA and RNA helicase [Clostridium pasteurianum DSM 525 = ATCC 6013]
MEGTEYLNRDEEMELQEERIKLAGVIDIINREILSYIQKRKDITKYILDSRKKNVEEFEDDEDKIIEYFDHERFVKEEAFKTIDRRLKELIIMELSPYFGRVDFKEEDEDQRIYIGRFGVTPEDAYEPLIVDWRAPVSALFYTSSLGKNTYTAPLGNVEADIIKKRQYIIKKKKLIGLFDSSMDVKDDILQLVLSKNAGEKLKDIVMSIQQEQDNIIRQPRNKIVVVNGVAGSGKTTIALHRVAYLLYNHRDILQNKVLILGPNPIFMEYISSVLPSLGEVGVNQKTYRDFATELLDIRQRDIMTTKEYMERILKGDNKFIESVAYKNSDKFIEDLHKLIEQVEKNNYQFKDVIYNNKVVVKKSEIEEMYTKYYNNMPLFRRVKKLKRIIFSKLKDERDNIIRKIQQDYRETISKLSEDELKLQGTSLDYKRKLKIRETIKLLIDVKKGLTWLGEPSIEELYRKEISEKPYTIDDLTALLYLSIKFEGLTINREIKHVVIDEAQDYSKLAFKVIRELTGCNGMTIVGDGNQRLIPLEGEVPFNELDDLIKNTETEHFKLNKSYRSTKEIMEYANKFLGEDAIVPLVRNGEVVKILNPKSEEEFIETLDNTVKDYTKKEFDSIAVVCRDLNSTDRYGKFLSKNNSLKIIDREDMIYQGGTVVIPSYLAKGLEFDAVIIVEDGKYTEKDKFMYVMATRALHELAVVNAMY